MGRRPRQCGSHRRCPCRSRGRSRGSRRPRRFLAETGAKTDDGEHLELLDALVGNDHAALYFRITAARQGRPPLDNLTLHLVRLENGQIAEIWFHNFDGAAVAAFWA